MDEMIVVMSALMLGAGWASGINLYAAMLAIGIMGKTGAMALPEDLAILSHPLVIFAAGTGNNVGDRIFCRQDPGPEYRLGRLAYLHQNSRGSGSGDSGGW